MHPAGTVRVGVALGVAGPVLVGVAVDGMAQAVEGPLKITLAARLDGCVDRGTAKRAQ